MLGAYTETNQTYCNEEDTAVVQLQFRCYETFVLTSVQAEIKNANDFGKQLCFAAKNGIIIHVQGMSQIDGLITNYQQKEWWTRPHFDRKFYMV